MNGIPPLDTGGRLPDGVHRCEMEHIRATFVDQFATSLTRPSIFGGFERLRGDAAAHSIVATQWVNGSFVTDKVDPGDVDVVHFVDYDHLNELPAAAVHFVRRYLCDTGWDKHDYRTHSQLVPACDPGHPQYDLCQQHRQFWRRWFGRERDLVAPDGTVAAGSPKGILEVALSGPEQPPGLREEGA